MLKILVISSKGDLNSIEVNRFNEYLYVSDMEFGGKILTEYSVKFRLRIYLKPEPPKIRSHPMTLLNGFGM